MRLQTWKRLIARSGTGALATLLAWGASSLLWAGEPGARAVFWRLPTTIFENTVPGLSENEKYELLVQGATEHWAIRHSSHDVLEIAEAPDGDSTVLLRLFRGNGYVLAAIGTDSGPVCSTELWRLDARGGAVPAASLAPSYLRLSQAERERAARGQALRP